MSYGINTAPLQYESDDLLHLRGTRGGHEVLVPYTKVLTGGVLGQTFFWSDKPDCTDELIAFLAKLKPRLEDEFGGNNDQAAILKVNFLGRLYQLSSMIDLTKEFAGIILSNGALAATNSVSWVSQDSMIKIRGGAAKGDKIVSIGVEDFRLDCGRYVDAGLTFDNTNQCWASHVEVSRQKLRGIQAIRSNRSLHLAKCRAQEWGNGEVDGKDMDNRTSVGIYIEHSDGVMSECVVPICKIGIELDSIRNFAVHHCHPWMGDLLDEAQRFTAWSMKIGGASDDPDDGPTSTGASGIQITSCYFDHGPLFLDGSFSVQINNSIWTGGEDGIYPIVAMAHEANTNASGLKITNVSCSQEHNKDFIDWQVDGVDGEWAPHKLHVLSCVTQGAQEVLMQKLAPTLWAIENGDNGKKESNPYNSLTRLQLSPDAVTIPVANRIGTLAMHSPYEDACITITRWGDVTTPPAVYCAWSRSTELGTFGGFPQAGDVLGVYGATGDNGTDFSAPGGAFDSPKPGAAMMMVAAALWTAASNPTHIDFLTTPVGGVGDATRVLRISSAGHVEPQNDNNQWLGSAAASFYIVRSRRLQMQAVGGDGNVDTLAGNGTLYVVGNQLKFRKPDGTTAIIV